MSGRPAPNWDVVVTIPSPSTSSSQSVMLCEKELCWPTVGYLSCYGLRLTFAVAAASDHQPAIQCSRRLLLLINEVWQTEQTPECKASPNQQRLWRRLDPNWQSPKRRLRRIDFWLILVGGEGGVTRTNRQSLYRIHFVPHYFMQFKHFQWWMRTEQGEKERSRTL